MKVPTVPLTIPLFPNTLTDPFYVTSQPTKNYNCIAWAYEDPAHWYWPDTDYDNFWPDNIPREVTLSAFQQLFENKGYEVCSDHSLENGFQKIAIYSVLNNIPTHAARQLPNGNWTSKLGRSYDVSHTIQNMDDGHYGKVVLIMRKKLDS